MTAATAWAWRPNTGGLSLGLAEHPLYFAHRLRAYQAAPPSATAPVAAAMTPASRPALPPDEASVSRGWDSAEPAVAVDKQDRKHKSIRPGSLEP